MTVEGTETSPQQQDLMELRAEMQRVTFPAFQDDILASLVAGRCPARLLWRAACLRRERMYLTVAEVFTELAEIPAGPLR